MGDNLTSTIEPGRTVAGRYHVKSLLGKGGFGAVYEAEHVELGKTVALKVLLPKLAENGEVVTRFMREARAAAAIGHPGVVEVFDLGREEGVAFIAMEKLEGEELFDRIQREHPLDPAFVARVGADLADAMSAAHEHGIVHRDLKPQNVFLATRGRQKDVVKVLDFGIAKLAEADPADVPLTRTGQVFGTPLYMSPAMLRGAKDIDGREDVYAMGAILYEALAGHPPFSAATYPELVLKIASEDPVPLSSARPDVPPALAAIVARAMSRDREARHQSARELAEALERFLQDPEASAARPSVAGFVDTMPSGPVSVITPRSETPFVSESMKPPAPSRRKRGRVLAGALALLVAGGIGSAWWMASGTEGPSATSPAAIPAAPVPPAAIPEDDPEAAPAEEPPAPEPAAPVTRTVRFETLPRGVSVEIGGDRRCTAPCSLELPEEPTRAVLSLGGYRSTVVPLEPPFPEVVERRLLRARVIAEPSEPATPMTDLIIKAR